ncbi:MAG: 3'(2'),5'-bisphosphate nucleotidase CysQ [Bacteroidales bacterium]|nr:3'(2'),5'-bisphosphate nucleotidase CysQ [Bacteroidales bacterium]
MADKKYVKDLILTAIKASVQAGKAILKVYESNDFHTSIKADNSPLTQADKNAHNVIMQILQTTNLPVLSEEGKDIPYSERKDWELFWLVDPLDGTKEFIKKNGDFTVNIALIENNIPVAGVIYIPVNGILYFAEKSIGAYKMDYLQWMGLEIENLEFLIDISEKLPVDKTEIFTVVGSRSHMNDETKEAFEKLEKEHGKIEIISRGSSLKLCMIAEGKADSYPRFGPTMEWDIAAGHAIVTAAGGSVTKIDSSPLNYNKENLLNPYFIAKK